MKLRGSGAIVTGAGHGIGRALAGRLGTEGVATDRGPRRMRGEGA
jgi:NAD(P)-dependent dehydrogenase (short-subunit alcohol dehydrogenase family)